MTPNRDSATVVLHSDLTVRILAVLGALVVAVGAAARMTEPSGGLREAVGVRMVVEGFAGGSAAAWFASLLLLLCGALLGWLAADSRSRAGRYAAHWTVLAVLFVGLALLRVSGIAGPLATDLGVGSTGSWAGAGFVIAVLLLAYRRFFRHLTWSLKVAAGPGLALFVVGALGGAFFGAALAPAGVEGSVTTLALFTAAEALEIGGLLLLLHGLVRHAALDAEPLSVRLEDAEDESDVGSPSGAARPDRRSAPVEG